MTSVEHVCGLSCTLEVLPCAHAVEFVAFGAATGAVANDWPRAPGAVRRGLDGWPTVLHFAPARWLLPEPDRELIRLMVAASEAGIGSAIDVGGKWTAMTLWGAGTARLLAATIDVGAVLEARDCAAVELFDCPALLTCAAYSYRIYVKSSYAAALCAAVELLGAALASKLAP